MLARTIMTNVKKITLLFFVSVVIISAPLTQAMEEQQSSRQLNNYTYAYFGKAIVWSSAAFIGMVTAKNYASLSRNPAISKLSALYLIGGPIISGMCALYNSYLGINQPNRKLQTSATTSTLASNSPAEKASISMPQSGSTAESLPAQNQEILAIYAMTDGTLYNEQLFMTDFIQAVNKFLPPGLKIRFTCNSEELKTAQTVINFSRYDGRWCAQEKPSLDIKEKFKNIPHFCIVYTVAGFSYPISVITETAEKFKEQNTPYLQIITEQKVNQYGLVQNEFNTNQAKLLAAILQKN